MLGTTIFDVCDHKPLVAQNSAYEQLDVVLTVVEDGGWLIIVVIALVIATFGQRLRCRAKDRYSSRKRRHQA